MTTADDGGLVFTGVARQAQLVRDRQVSPHELVALYLERIARLDPLLNAFRVVLAEQAMAEAAQVERRLAAGEVLPLAGVGFGATPIFTRVLPASGVVPYSNPLTQLVVTVVLHTGSTE